MGSLPGVLSFKRPSQTHRTLNNRKKVTGYINMKKSTKFYLLDTVCWGRLHPTR